MSIQEYRDFIASRSAQTQTAGRFLKEAEESAADMFGGGA